MLPDSARCRRLSFSRCSRGRGRSVGAPRDRGAMQRPLSVPLGFVTLPFGEREVSAPQELLGRCDCGPPRLHRRGAQRAVRLGRGEMALDVKGVVDGGVCGKKFLG